MFSVNTSSGRIEVTGTDLDFETAKSHTLTLTATASGETTSTNVVVPVQNVNETNSVVLRYSADYNSVSRTGFAATATRGPSGSSLPNYYLEQVGTAPTDDITNVDNTSNNSVPVEIAGGSALNWRYFFPTDTGGAGQYAFAPNSASVEGKYKSLLGTSVETTILNSEIISAGRMRGGNFWFMTTDKAGAAINYENNIGYAGDLGVRFDYSNYYHLGLKPTTGLSNLLFPIFNIDLQTGSSALNYTLMTLKISKCLFMGIDNTCNLLVNRLYSWTQRAAAKSFVQQDGRTLILVGENG